MNQFPLFCSRSLTKHSDIKVIITIKINAINVIKNEKTKILNGPHSSFLNKSYFFYSFICTNIKLRKNISAN